MKNKSFRELVNEAVEVDTKKIDNVIDNIKKLVGEKYQVLVKYYGGLGVQPIISVEPLPDKDKMKKIEALIQNTFKRNKLTLKYARSYVMYMLK
jgi:hypothetical protein